MNKNSLIEDLKERVKQLDSQIITCKERIKNAGFVNDYKKELSELNHDKDQLEEQIHKLKDKEISLIKKLVLTIDNLFYKVTENIRKLSETVAIKAKDKKVMEEHLEKHQKTVSDYFVTINIKRLEKKGKALIVDRIITIENKNSGQKREYTAGTSAKQLWFVEFDKDLEMGKFEK